MDFRTTLESLRGSIAPVVTPFSASGVDLEAQAALIDWQIASGSHGISVTGTTGEPSALTEEERVAVIESAAGTVADRVPFVPGTGSNNLEETLRLTGVARECGADAVLLIVPYYNRPSQAGLFEWFSAIARAYPDLPIVIYNIPGRTAVNLAPETLARLSEAHRNVVGVKESNKDFEQVSRVLHKCGRDFLLFSGIELLCYPMLAVGGAGSISATANLLPDKVAELHEAAFAGDHGRALDLHYELLELNDALFLETNPGPLKWAMEKVGILESGQLRLPLVAPSPENRERIAAALKQHRFAAPARAGGG